MAFMKDLITLLKDFSDRDRNVGVMKNVISGIDPRARILEIIHSIAPYKMRQTTNIRAYDLEKKPNTLIIIKNMEINGIRNIFIEGIPSELPAMMASFGYLRAGVANGSAAETLGAGAGEIIRVDFLPI